MRLIPHSIRESDTDSASFQAFVSKVSASVCFGRGPPGCSMQMPYSSTRDRASGNSLATRQRLTASSVTIRRSHPQLSPFRIRVRNRSFEIERKVSQLTSCVGFRSPATARMYLSHHLACQRPPCALAAHSHDKSHVISVVFSRHGVCKLFQ
jgi:hypothetical protein